MAPRSWYSGLKKSLSRSKKSCLPYLISQPPETEELQETSTCTKSSTCLFQVRPTRDDHEKSSFKSPITNIITKQKKESFHTLTTLEFMAAIRIQSVFRMHLAMKALRALKALVRLQALVRGYCVRRRTELTLKCLSSLLRIQERSRMRRLMSLNMFIASDHDDVKASSSCTTHPDCKSDQDIHENHGLSIQEVLAAYAVQKQTHAILRKLHTEFPGQVNLEDFATRRNQGTNENLGFLHSNNRSNSAQRTPNKLSTSRIALKNSRVHNPSADFSSTMPRTPNYMASTKSARARTNNTRCELRTAVVLAPSSICSALNSPRKLKLAMKRNLSPVRTGRSSVIRSPGKFYGEPRNMVRKLMVQQS